MPPLWDDVTEPQERAIAPQAMKNGAKPQKLKAPREEAQNLLTQLVKDGVIDRKQAETLAKVLSMPPSPRPRLPASS
ncbi:MAG: hypothetical protein PVH64_02370 [Bacillota bacterium]|jgi:hypothetical protein